MTKVIVGANRKKIEDFLFAKELLELDFRALKRRLWGFTSDYDQRRWLIKGLNVFAFCAILNHWQTEPTCQSKEVMPDLLFFSLQLLITENSWFSTRSLVAFLNAHAIVSKGEKLLFWQDGTLSASSLALNSALNLANVVDVVDTWVGPR